VPPFLPLFGTVLEKHYRDSSSNGQHFTIQFSAMAFHPWPPLQPGLFCHWQVFFRVISLLAGLPHFLLTRCGTAQRVAQLSLTADPIAQLAWHILR
jgi:hypothetical protein